MLISQDQFIARKLGMTGQFQYRPFLVDAKTFEDRVEQTNMCVDRIPGSPWRSHVDKPCAPSKSAGSVSPETSPVKSATSTAPTVSTDTSSREPKSNDLQSELQAAGYVYRGWLGSGNSVNVRKCGGPSCAVVTELQPGETTNVYVKNDPASDWSAVRIVTGVSDSKKQTVVEGYMKNTVINSRLVSEGL